MATLNNEERNQVCAHNEDNVTTDHHESALRATEHNTHEKDDTQRQQQCHDVNTITKAKAKVITKKNTDKNEDAASASKHLLYYKRAGAMSVTGQLYETKLLTLILLRFVNDKNVDKFYLGTNISGAGAMDDLCFKYKPANSEKHIIVFLQAKHKVNPDKGKITMTDVQSYGGDFSVEKHFESYLMIRQRFTPKSSDIIFKGAYHESRCYFVVYTPLKHDIECRRPLEQNDTNQNVKDLIQTNRSGDIFQLDYKDFNFLTKNLVENRMKQLGNMFLELMLSGNDKIMEEELIKKYHVVLLLKVIDVSDTDARKGKFRHEFFDNKEKLTTIFRESLYDEAVKNKALSVTDAHLKFLNRVNDDPSIENISKVIGNIVTYDEKTNLLVPLDENLNVNKEFDLLKQKKVEPSTVRNAINMKGKEILQQLEIKLPAGFGNKDLSIKAKKTEQRLDFLAVRLARLLENAVFLNGLNFVDVDDGMVGPDGLVERGVVEHNGGLGSALGNLLVLDSDTDALKFNTSEPLPELAGKLWSKLKSTHDEELLTTYRFKFRIDCFPKAYFEDNWYEEYLVKDFISHYWLCTGQAKEDTVESIAKNEVNKYIKTHTESKPIFLAKTDAIFLMLHDIMQKWWMLPVKADYLTEDTKYLKRAMSEVIDSQLLSVLNLICVSKLRSSAIEFNEDALVSLGLDESACGLVIIDTDSVTHTALKLMQHYKQSRNCTFIDFNYVTRLMFCNFQDIANEVKKSSDIDTLIITCKANADERIWEVLTYFIIDLKKKNIILIVDNHLSASLKQELTCTYHEVKDTKNSPNYLSSESQEKILTECKVVFQGEEVNLKAIIGDDIKQLITSHALQAIVNKETIEIGKPLATSSYNKMKEFYVERNLIEYVKNIKDDPEECVSVTCVVRTLKDLSRDIVVVTAPPGMGKSTLLIHLSLGTKKEYPDVWIARINLLDHSKQFHQWQKHKTAIDNIQALAFITKAVSSSEVEYEFENTGEEILVKRNNMSAGDLLQADLFVNCYRNGKAIVIFDGFDEICPLYENEVIQLIKIIANVDASCDDRVMKPKVWIASRSYNNVKHIIEREFGLSYSLEPLSKVEHLIYLNKLWRKTMRLDEFSYEQLLNINSFIDYMRQFWDVSGSQIKPIVVGLYEIYFAAVHYFQNEIRNILLSPEKEVFKESWNLRMGCPSHRRFRADNGRLNADFSYIMSTCHLTGSPLHSHIATEFFHNQIKYNLSNYDSNKWDLGNNTFFIYEQFLETKLLKIRFEEKNRIDIYNPDNIAIHERERKEFIDMHRKLAFYSVFQDKSATLMSERKLNEVRSMIEKIKYATEKTGVIDCIVDDVPKFVHIIFAEYFAVDYICTMLKMAFALKNNDRLQTIWQFVLSPYFRGATLGFTNIFDYKLIFDAKLKEILENECTQKMVFECLLDQANTIDDDSENKDVWKNVETTYFDILSRGMKYASAFLLKCIIKYLNRDNIDKFVTLISYKDFLGFALHRGFEDIVCQALDYIRDIDITELERALNNNGLRYGSGVATVSNDQIINDLRNYNLTKTRFKHPALKDPRELPKVSDIRPAC